MALTQAQWEKKLRSLTPSWVFEREKLAVSIFRGMGAVLAKVQEQAEIQRDQKFLSLADVEYVSLQALDRSTPGQFDEEPLDSFRDRVRNIVNQSNLPAIKKMVNSMLINGTCVIIEHADPQNFLDRGGFLNRLVIDFDVLYNAFTILIDDQSPEPSSFLDRVFFLDREAFTGSGIENSEVFTNIIKTVNQNKAYGTVYRLIERAPT